MPTSGVSETLNVEKSVNILEPFYLKGLFQFLMKAPLFFF